MGNDVVLRIAIVLCACFALMTVGRSGAYDGAARPQEPARNKLLQRVAETDGDTVEIHQGGDRYQAPTIVLRIPQQFRFRSSIGQTQSLGINLITFYPDFTSLADPRNYAYGSGCIGYCNGQMMVSIENVPADWSASLQKRLFDEGYLGGLTDHKPTSFGMEVDDINPILGFDKVFDQRLVDIYRTRILLKEEGDNKLAPLSAECSMKTTVQVCELFFTLKCAPVVDIKIIWPYDHLSEAFQLQKRVDDFVSAMLVQPQCAR
jgi:hypothetical protein